MGSLALSKTNKIHSLAIAAVLAGVPSLAAAEVNGMLTLGYSMSDIEFSPNDINALTLDFSGTYDVGNGLSFGLDAGLSKADISGAPVDFDLAYFGLNAKYSFANGVSLGAYAERGQLDTNLPIPTGKLNSYGLTVGYENDKLSGEAYFGFSTTKPGLPSDLDIADYGLRGRYEFSEAGFGTVAIGRTRLNTPGPSVDLDMIALGGGYAFNDRFMMYGGLQRASIDLVNAEMTTIGLGVAYQTTAISAVPAILSLEMARSRLSTGGPSIDVDTIRVGISVPLSKSGSRVPLNSVVNSIDRGSHSVLTSGVLAAF